MCAVAMSSGAKRRRTDADLAPEAVTSTQNEDAGGDLAESDEELICQSATRVLKKYSLGGAGREPSQPPDFRDACP